MAKTKSKYYYDKKMKPCIFNTDDYVYLLKQPQKVKLDNQYVGPFVILDKTDNHIVKLAIEKKRTKIVHEDKLKKANMSSKNEIDPPDTT